MPFSLAVVNVCRAGARIVGIAASSIGNPLHQLVLEEVELVTSLVKGYFPFRGHVVDRRWTLAEQLAGFCHTDGYVQTRTRRAVGDGRQHGDDGIALLMEGCQRFRHPVKGKCSHVSS